MEWSCVDAIITERQKERSRAEQSRDHNQEEGITIYGKRQRQKATTDSEAVKRRQGQMNPSLPLC